MTLGGIREVGKTLKARDNTILSEIEEMLGNRLIRNDRACTSKSSRSNRERPARLAGSRYYPGRAERNQKEQPNTQPRRGNLAVRVLA